VSSPSQVADIAAFEKLVSAQAREPNTGFIPMPSSFMAGREIAPIFTRNNVPTVGFNPPICQGRRIDVLRQ
jgi:hypothetical protein